MRMEEFPKWKRELPGVPHKVFNEPLSVLVEYYKEHIQRDLDAGQLAPPDPWIILRGFLVAAMQTYASICILLADKRPKRLMLQAGILNRSLFEIFATIVALTEDLVPRSQILARESYKGQALRHAYWVGRFGSDPQWKEYLEVSRKGLALIAKKLALASEVEQEPAKIKDAWPAPGVMIKGRPKSGVPPFVSGTRRAVLKELYDSHYAMQSAQAHGRVAALGLALLVDDASLQWNPGQGESEILQVALIIMAGALSEIEFVGGFTHHPKLAELWTYLREAHGEARELWAIRYEALSQTVVVART